MDFLSTTTSFTDACVLEEDNGGTGAAWMLSQLSSPQRPPTRIQTETAALLASMRKEHQHDPPLPTDLVQRIFSSPEETSSPPISCPSPGVTSELEFDTALDLINVHKRMLPPLPTPQHTRPLSPPVPVSPSHSDSNNSNTDDPSDTDISVAPAQKAKYSTYEYKNKQHIKRNLLATVKTKPRGRPPRKLYKKEPTPPTARKSTPLAQAVKRRAAGPQPPKGDIQILRRGTDPRDEAPTWVRIDGGILCEYKEHKLQDTIVTYHPDWTPDAKIDDKDKDIHFETLSEGWARPCQEDLRECGTNRQQKALFTFYARLNELRQYIQHYGDANVPQQFPPAHSLGIWVNKIRMEKKKLDAGNRTNLTQRKVDLLEHFGFIWAQNCKGENGWEMRFEELKQFKNKYGHCDVPTKCHKNRALGRWVSTQRAVYKVWKRRRLEGPIGANDTIDADGRGVGLHRDEVERRIHALEELGFNFCKLQYGETHIKSKGGAIVLTYIDKPSNKKRKDIESTVLNEMDSTKKMKVTPQSDAGRKDIASNNAATKESFQSGDFSIIPSPNDSSCNAKRVETQQTSGGLQSIDVGDQTRNLPENSNSVDVTRIDSNKENDNQEGADEENRNVETKGADKAKKFQGLRNCKCDEIEKKAKTSTEVNENLKKGSNENDAKEKMNDYSSSEANDTFFGAKDSFDNEDEQTSVSDNIPKPRKGDGNTLSAANKVSNEKESVATSTTLQHILARAPKVGTTRSAREDPVGFLQRLITFMGSTPFGTEHQSILHRISHAVDENAQLRQTPLWKTFHSKFIDLVGKDDKMNRFVQQNCA